MIMETATIHVIPGREAEFLSALAKAKDVLARAAGWQVIHVHRGIERPDVFMLAIGWESLEAHTVGFRGGELFVEWRELIGPYFAQPPEVEHWEFV
jgi:heme-degrading monooxygenase HmoA